MTLQATGPADTAGPVGGPASVDYSHIPFIPRRWGWQDVMPIGNPVMLAAAGGTGKGLLTWLITARVVLGLPFPGEDPALRRAPGRVVHIAGSEDDPFEDLAPRARAAIAAAVEEFGLDAELAGEHGAIRFVHDLSEWPDGSPFEVPGDMGRLAAEVGKLNKLDKHNRAPDHPDYSGPGPSVSLVILDPFADMLGEKSTISTVKGARAVLKPIKLITRQLDIALIIVHHLTKDGKVSGSPAVVDALRLAFIIERGGPGEAEDVRVIMPAKSNIASGQAQRYRITGHGAATRAEFIAAEDARTARVERAAERAAEAPAPPGAGGPLPGSRRARYAAVAADAGPFAVLRGVRAPGAADSSPTARSYLGREYVTRADAWRAVAADCGAVLTPAPVDGMPGAYVAGAKMPDGSRVSYLVKPAG